MMQKITNLLKQEKKQIIVTINSNIVLKDGNILLIGGGKTRLGAEIYKVNKKIKR